MDFHTHFKNAQQLADQIDDWKNDSFSWKKAYVACVFAALAYEEVPEFELRKIKRAKIIPCDRYQAHISRWVNEQRRASVNQLDANIEIQVIIRDRVVVTITKLRQLIFISLRGTTLSFSDFKADLDARKARYSIGFGESVKLHRGFLDAVLACIDEVVERVNSLNTEHVPVYVTGHSLGGAMAAVMHAALTDDNFGPFGRRRRRHRGFTTDSAFAFGMPRYGDIQAKALLPQPYHIFNEFDAIPTLPPTFMGFADSSNERCLNAIPEQTIIVSKGNCALRSSKGIATILGISDHRMEKYEERLDVMRGK